MYNISANGANTILGNHMARSGVIVLFSATTFRASNENTNMKAKAIPMARFIPSPPLFFWEERDSAKKVSMTTDAGMEVL